MKPKVTTAIASLLLLSAITSVEFHPLHDHSMRESSMENCADYKNISKWLDLQDSAANILQSHYAHLEEALSYLTGTKVSANCCFYDKDLMQKVMDNVNNINQQNGISASKTLSPSGDIRNDLNKIIPRIKNLVSKSFESCCSKMEESLKKIKKDFNEQLGSVKKKFKSGANDEFSKDKKELEEKHQSLKDEIKDTKEGLNKLESKKMSSGQQMSCCDELNTKTEALEKQIQAERTKTLEKTNQFESQLRDIESTLNALKNRTKNAKNTIETQGEAIEKELESCEKEFDKISKKSNNNYNCCEPCLNKLVDRLKELEEHVMSLIKSMSKVDSNNGNNKDGNPCLENDKRIIKIKELADKSQILKSGNNSVTQIRTTLANENLKDRIKELEKEVQELQQAANDSQIYCENIDKLGKFAEDLQYKIQEMQQNYPELLKQYKMEFEGLKRILKETLTQVDNIKNKAKDKETEKEKEKLKGLQAMLQKSKSELQVQAEELNELLRQKNKDNPIDIFEIMTKEFDQSWLEVDERLSQLESKHNATDSMMKQYKDLSQKLSEAKISSKGQQQEEKQYQAELEKLKPLENQVTKCLKACKDVPKMHDLIKNVKDIVQKVQDKKKSEVARSEKTSNIFKIPKH